VAVPELVQWEPGSAQQTLTGPVVPALALSEPRAMPLAMAELASPWQWPLALRQPWRRQNQGRSLPLQQPLALAVAQGALREVAPAAEVLFETWPQVAALQQVAALPQVAVSGSPDGPPFPEMPLTLAAVLVLRWDASATAVVGSSVPQVALVALLASVEGEAGPVNLL